MLNVVVPHGVVAPLRVVGGLKVLKVLVRNRRVQVVRVVVSLRALVPSRVPGCPKPDRGRVPRQGRVARMPLLMVLLEVALPSSVVLPRVMPPKVVVSLRVMVSPRVVPSGVIEPLLNRVIRRPHGVVPLRRVVPPRMEGVPGLGMSLRKVVSLRRVESPEVVLLRVVVVQGVAPTGVVVVQVVVPSRAVVLRVVVPFRGVVPLW